MSHGLNVYIPFPFDLVLILLCFLKLPFLFGFPMFNPSKILHVRSGAKMLKVLRLLEFFDTGWLII